MPKSLLRTETVRYGEAEVVLETATLYSQMLRNELGERLEKVIQREKNYIFKYAEVVTQARKFHGLGFDLPDPDAADEAHVQAFKAYMRLPVPLIGDLMATLDKLNTPPNSKPELAPGATSDDPKDEKPVKNNSAA